jgi:diaminopropionate ammonia-lyase
MFRLNRLPMYGQPLDPGDARYLDADAARRTQALLDLCPVARPTRLCSLPALARQLAIGALFVKDESTRLGLGSFKALGGAHAVLQVVLEKASQALGRQIAAEELLQPEISAIARRLTVACATDGNHGRSVAAGARFTGCRAVIFIHAGVSEERAAAIGAFGAELRRVPGVYADAVAAAAREAAAAGWTVVSDTAWPGYERIPQLVTQGYTVMVREAIDGMPVPPTHVFVQAGVGGLAAAVAGHLASTLGEHRPRIVIVEPERSACLLASHDAGGRIVIAQDRATVMAMLECQEPSLTAWRVLSRLADAFMTVDEDDAVQAMQQLANPAAEDPAIVAGESGGAGFAGLAVAASSQEMRDALDVSDESIILLFNTEGATDSASYTRLVGRAPEQVAARIPV